MLDVNILIFESLFSGLAIGFIIGRLCKRHTKAGTPSASHNKQSTQSIAIQHAYFAGHRDGINQVIISYGWKAYRQRTL
jgi:hypothetical protein